MQRTRRATLATAALVAGAWGMGVGVTTPALAAPHHHARHVFVSPSGAAGNSGHGCGSASYSSIQDAVDAAAAWSTVEVCPGTYAEDVLVAKPLTLRGHHATIDATGLENAVHVMSSHVTVERLALVNANGEGILVGADTPADADQLFATGSPVLTHDLVRHVRAADDNKGFNGTEQSNCDYAGDCGGGIHLNVTAWSAVIHSTVVGNSDGILLTDDYGPASHNLIAHNRVTDNTTECGIVLPSHNPGAVSYDPDTYTVTGRNPDVGGIYDNVVAHNVALRNGTATAPPEFGGGGSGSGIGLFGSGPGTGVYDNLIIGNRMAGNGLAGFTIHAHLPGGEDVNGNAVVRNHIGRNNTGGDGYDGPPGPTDFDTTGIAVYSAPTVTMVISRNHIHDDVDGIWLSTTVTADGLNHNHFHHVTHHVVTG